MSDSIASLSMLMSSVKLQNEVGVAVFRKARDLESNEVQQLLQGVKLSTYSSSGAVNVSNGGVSQVDLQA